MFLIQAKGIKKSFGTRTVLDFESLSVYSRDKIGIVGANGAGKTTLLHLLSGEIQPDEGAVVRHCDVSYIRQFTPDRDETRSGGENAKAQILGETLREQPVLFADEPTANLDADGQAWVLRKLRAAETLLLISHDRALLDAVCTRIIEVKDGALTDYTGNYSDYEAAVEVQRRRQEQEYDDYRRKKTQLEAAQRQRERKASKMRKAPSRMGNSEARLAKFKAIEQQEKVERQSTVLKARLDRMEKVEKPRDLPAIRMDFSLTDPPGNKYVIRCEGLTFSYGKREIFRDARFEVPGGAHLALTGRNGAGKTTLLRLIHEGHDAITCVPKLKPGFLQQNFESLDPHRSVLDNALLTSIQDHASVRSVLAGLLFFGDDVHKKVEVLSGGEKMRLSLAKLLLGDFNALLLDEPTNYLDLRSMQAVSRVLDGYPGTILIVSHDRKFLDDCTTGELLIEDAKVRNTRQNPTQKPQENSKTRRMVLEMRATQLVTAISSAPAEQKPALEKQYNETIQTLREMGSA